MSVAKALSPDTVPPLVGVEPRPSEPSMEDILASIRRIIADDQSRHAVAAPARASVPPPSRPALPNGSAPLPPASRPDPTVAKAPPSPGTPAPRISPDASKALAGTPHVNPPPLSASPVSASPVSPGLQSKPPAAIAAAVQPPAKALGLPSDGKAPVAGFADLAPAPRPTAAPAVALQVEDRPVAAAQPLAKPAASPTPAATRPGPPPAKEQTVTEATPIEAGAEPLVSAETKATIETSFHSLATSVFLQNAGLVEGLVRDMLRPMLKSWLDDNLPAVVERLVRVEIERVARGRS